jgi:hypothetical protein
MRLQNLKKLLDMRSIWNSFLIVVLSIYILFLYASPVSAESPQYLRYLAINVGNASPKFNCWEYKLCRKQDVINIRNYIATWKPDIILLSEVYRAEQLTGKAANGPILPKGYTGICGESRERNTNQLVAWNAKNSSHEHECIAWKISRLSLVENSPKSVYGSNEKKQECNYDFTGFRVKLLLENLRVITAVTVHPNSSKKTCRTEEISRYWSTLAEGEYIIIGGDWNTSSDKEIQKSANFFINYSKGKHWDLVNHSDEYSAKYLAGIITRKIDGTYSNFGEPCTICGSFYETENLVFGSVLGGYDDHPRADNGNGLDHRQILVDLMISHRDTLSVTSDQLSGMGRVGSVGRQERQEGNLDC